MNCLFKNWYIATLRFFCWCHLQDAQSISICVMNSVGCQRSIHVFISIRNILSHERA